MDGTRGDEPARPPPPDLQDAARRTLAAGPAHLVATVRSGTVSYRLRGRWDPIGGYRVCALIEKAPTSDDHSPTLELFGAHRRPGAEDYLHAALLALSGIPGPALVSDRPATIDFRTFDREPPRRDEDGWTLRPLLRRLGVRGIEVRVGRQGYVERLRLLGPVRVERRCASARRGESRTPARTRSSSARRACRGSLRRSQRPAWGCGRRARPSPPAPPPWPPPFPSSRTRSLRRAPSSCPGVP